MWITSTRNYTFVGYGLCCDLWYYTIPGFFVLILSFHFENILFIFVCVNIIARGTIQYYIAKYPKASTALLTWYHEFLKARFHNFNELKATYGNASIVTGNRIIFNIKGNDFRLVASVNFQKNAAYVIWFGTHSEYDKINVKTISFDVNILNFKPRS